MAAEVSASVFEVKKEHITEIKNDESAQFSEDLTDTGDKAGDNNGK